MDNQTHNQIASFIWGIADDCLRDVYVRGKYRDVILPMTVIRRLDAVLEDGKADVLAMKKQLDEAGIANQTEALCNAAGQSFCNSSEFRLRDLTSRAAQQKLKLDFIAYLDGFSPNVQEILEKFKFRNQIDTMIDADILAAVIEKFISPFVNLSPFPVLSDNGDIRMPGLDNHSMGVIFEELIRRFNEENNEEAGEHFTPRDVVELMADLIFLPIADKIQDSTYSVYDGASGTGGMLTVSQDRLYKLAEKNKRSVSIHLFGQEINPETYAITKADLLLKGEGAEVDNIAYGSTLGSDGFPSRQFDFMLSNPPYGKSWKNDADKMGGKDNIQDTRFVKSFADDPEFSMVPRVSDGQLLFLLNNISKMKEGTELGSRIAEVHNGSSLFTGDAGQGESNARRYMLERDLVEAIIALPENMFYNTGIGTFIWVLSNRKSKERKGKLQLIDATSLKSPLRKNLGQKNCEFSPGLRKKIIELYLAFAENEYSKIFATEEFGYYEITVENPLKLKVEITEENLAKLKEKLRKNDQYIYELVIKLRKEDKKNCYLDYNEYLSKLEKLAKDSGKNFLASHKRIIEANLCSKDNKAEKVIKNSKKKGEEDSLYGTFKVDKLFLEYQADTELRDTERIPLNYAGGIKEFFKKEVLPYSIDAWIDKSKIKIGYEISFTKHFYKPIKLRKLSEIAADIIKLEKETKGLLNEVLR